MKQMMSEESVEPEVNEESQGIDGIIETVQSYIQDPSLVTVDTLTQLKSDLEDLKSVLDGEDGGEENPGDEGSLSGALMKMRGGE